MLRVIHQIASHGWVYDRIQDVVGAREVYRRLGRHLVGPSANRWVLDVGGGTGRTRRLLPGDTPYVCLDVEEPKLTQFRRAGNHGAPVLGDATRMPFRTGSVGMAVCVDVSHHLSDDQLATVLAEVRRVLHPSGRFVFLDAIFSERMLGRVLWSLDRGSHPRPPETLRHAVARQFQIQADEQFRLAHEYVLLVSQPLPPLSTP